MGGIGLLIGFELCGLIPAFALFRRIGTASRIWLGLCLGLAEMMWFPALYAFAFGFTLKAQWFALGTAAGLTAAGLPLHRLTGLNIRQHGDPPLRLILFLVIPLLLLSICLQYTHTLRTQDGALYVGQSTYGDLCLHLGIATGMKNASFPPCYTLIRGVELGYPFLSDSMVTTMLLGGTSLRTAFVLTGSLMMGLVFLGWVLLAWEMTHSRAAVILGFLLTFFNGGLGFLYVIDSASGGPTLSEVFTGFYQTPTNLPALNLRWVNVICDMMIPQRTLLAGWMMLLPALCLLVRAQREGNRYLFILLGIWAGAMPMVHTHSFLALGLISLGCMISSLIRAGKNRHAVLLNYLVYGSIAVILSLPQLLKWTFPQTAAGGSLRLSPGWVNVREDGSRIDPILWFWLKNLGPVCLLLVPAGLSVRRTDRGLALGALIVFLIAVTVQFQPNLYDNNKLLYAAFLLMTPMVGLLLARMGHALRGLKCRGILLGVFLAVSVCSALLSIGRETVSSYRLFSPAEAEAGVYAEAETPREAVFLTGTQHNDPIAALAGRQIVCGSSSYLFFHGISSYRQEQDVRLMYSDPGNHTDLMELYEICFVYISSWERGSYAVDEEWFAKHGTLVFDMDEVRIYQLERLEME